ncbi:MULTISPECIES: hypothetical protein [unclassified Planococcus (in: firmicutes)]|uniref:DUF6998 domain-containing protein n=1 Tax=Planococcus TaxID=1372 RepID=UPI000C3200A6|nr:MULTISPECIES: hypothetical protein [unclassified Planococcus (in: firmicutes)]AUD13088.1 hypothetical protein CW734_04570 [Planococcus sp. MB-3u-03]PKG45429.1 hypothetical protein CXF66_12480 [Planococcus sp. Urea-trap-24]PKG88975.1 hypothetical protein CXF91_09055 [Planococcus sp. Urea-3u-39]PKH36343.1 hypothetical protein CXF77_14725 [Planococcus sp. MB-3u-09]
MALTQMQIIQSLGEAMSWLEREISWGADPRELRHLIGRMGELYVAMYTNGNMADAVNERGYDVVTKDNERISVKTTARIGSTGFVAFNPNTLDLADRVIILRFNQEEMELEILLDAPIDEAKRLMTERPDGKLSIAMSKLFNVDEKVRSDEQIKVSKEARYHDYLIKELESGSIEVYEGDRKHQVVKPILRKVAEGLSIPIVNGNGNPYNTRQLGAVIIRALQDG